MTDMPSHGHPDGSTHLGRYCGDCPPDHRAFLAAQYDAERAPEGVVEEVAERLHDTWPHLFCDGFQTEVAREAIEAAGPWLAGDEPDAGQVVRYIAHHGIPTTVQADAGAPQLRRTCSCGTAWADEPGHDDEADAGSPAEKAARAREFIQWVAQNSIVAEDFTEGNDAFNELVRAARQLAAELGIPYQPGEGPADGEISAEEYEAWPGNQPGGSATGGSP
jgi:hypothetical protein